MKELDSFEIISMTQNYVFEVAASKTNIIFKLQINKTQSSAHQTYTAEFQSVAEMEKVQQYCKNFFQVKELLKVPGNLSIDLDKINITIHYCLPTFKKKKKIQTLFLFDLKKIEKQKKVNEQSIQKKLVTQRNLQLRIKILEQGFQQLRNQFKKFNVLMNQAVQPNLPSIYDRGVSFNSFIQAPTMFQNQYDCPIAKQQFFNQEVHKQVTSLTSSISQNQPQSKKKKRNLKNKSLQQKQDQFSVQISTKIQQKLESQQKRKIINKFQESFNIEVRKMASKTPQQLKIVQNKKQGNIFQSNTQLISAKWINPQYVTQKFSCNQNKIIAKEPTQIIGKIFNKQIIQFDIKILQMSKKIKIGIVDMLYCSKHSVVETPNIFYFQSDGLYRIGLQIKSSEHKGFAVMDNVKVRINFKACTIEWLIDSSIKLRLNIEKLKNKYIHWAPYIFLQSAKDKISIYQ